MFMFISNAVFLNLSFYHEIQSCDIESKVSGLESTGRQFFKGLGLDVETRYEVLVWC